MFRSVKREDRTIFARGLTNYSSQEIEKIKGCSTSSIAKVLGYKLYDEVIHQGQYGHFISINISPQRRKERKENIKNQICEMTNQNPNKICQKIIQLST